jgi:hypothetical protein
MDHGAGEEERDHEVGEGFLGGEMDHGAGEEERDHEVCEGFLGGGRWITGLERGRRITGWARDP